MKLNVRQNNLSKKITNIEKLVVQNKTNESLKQVAEILKRHIVQELEQSTIPDQDKITIERSLEIQTGIDGKIYLNTNTSTLANIEYGTTNQLEQPIILRARHSAQSEINQLILSMHKRG